MNMAAQTDKKWTVIIYLRENLWYNNIEIQRILAKAERTADEGKIMRARVPVSRFISKSHKGVYT